MNDTKHDIRPLIFWQYPKDPHHRCQLGSFALFPAPFCENHGVPSIDFASIVYQEHADHPIDID
jgi:hypothetical protein